MGEAKRRGTFEQRKLYAINTKGKNMGNSIITPDQIKAEACMKEINIVLKKYECGVMPFVTLYANGHTQGGFQIVPINMIGLEKGIIPLPQDENKN